MKNISWCPCLNTRMNFNLQINHAAYFVVNNPVVNLFVTFEIGFTDIYIQFSDMRWRHSNAMFRSRWQHHYSSQQNHAHHRHHHRTRQEVRGHGGARHRDGRRPLPHRPAGLASLSLELGER